MNHIKTLEDVYKELGEAPQKEFHLENSLTYLHIVAIVKAFNKGWKPNWDDKHEKKWVPQFQINEDFAFTNAEYYLFNCHANSELCFRDRESCEYAANQFIDVYKEFLL